jgi:hypothetical protein
MAVDIHPEFLKDIAGTLIDGLEAYYNLDDYNDSWGTRNLSSNVALIDFAPHNMTGYALPSPYVISANENWNPSYSAFSKNVDAEGYYTSHYTSGWIKIDLGTGNTKVLYSYALQAAYYTYFPRYWTMQGSNDNTNWNILHTVNNHPPPTTAWQMSEFHCTVHTTAYRYFMLSVSESHGGQFYLGEMYLYETAAGTSEYYSCFSPTYMDVFTEPYNNTTASAYGYTVSCSSYYSAYGNCYMPFDDAGTAWGSAYNAIDGEWLKLDLGETHTPQILYKYSFKPTSDFSGWAVQGSNNDVHWTTLDERTWDPLPYNGVVCEFVCNNYVATPFRYFRFICTAIYSGYFGFSLVKLYKQDAKTISYIGPAVRYGHAMALNYAELSRDVICTKQINFSVSLWAFLPNQYERGCFVHNGYTDGWALGIGTGDYGHPGTQMLLCLSGIGYYNTNISLQYNQWIHIVAVNIGGVSWQFYLNGGLNQTLTTYIPFTPTSFFTIGYYDSTTPYHFNGGLDEVALWNRSLTAQEVSAIYDGGQGDQLWDKYSDVSVYPRGLLNQ